MSVEPTGGLAPLFLGRVLTGNGIPVGSCWLVAPGLLVTAWYVVEQASGPIPVLWQDGDPGRPGSVVWVEPLRAGGGDPVEARVVALDAVHDLAVLAAAGFWTDRPPAAVASDGVRLNEPVVVTGFGTLEDPSRPAGLRHTDAAGSWAGQSLFEDAVRLAKVSSAQVLQGMSGAPVLRLSDGGVVGVVSSRYNSADGWGRDTVWVVRTEDVADLLEGVTDGFGLTGRPQLAEPATVSLCVGADSVRLRCAQLGIDVTAAHQGVSPGLSQALSDVRRARARAGSQRDQTPSPHVGGGDTSLVRVGELLGRTLLPGPVGAGLQQVLAQAERVSMPLHLGIELGEDARSARLRALPWEAVQVPGVGTPLALHHLVTVYRQTEAAAPRRVGGRLRIVVAIAAPTQGGAVVLDYERELRSVLSAVKAARAGQAQVTIVPFATTAAIHQALQGGDVHVLHLSGHGLPGRLLLEDESGNVRPVSAEEFVAEAVPPGCMPPLVCLAACYTNVAAPEPGSGAAQTGTVASFADGLVRTGAPVVVGTETSVTDRYATRIFATLYSQLARAADTDPVVALSVARRMVQASFTASTDPRDQAVSELNEWTTVTVLASRAGQPLIATTPTSVTEIPAVEPAYRRIGPLVGLDPGLFVGRRTDQRQLPPALAGMEPAALPGIVLWGIGGIGKTTLAVELARRATEIESSLVVIPISGPLTVDMSFAAISAALRARLVGSPQAGQLAPLLQELERVDLAWQDRWDQLSSNLLDAVPFLLVLDNFEDNLTTPTDTEAGASRQVRDDTLADLLACWLETPGRSHLLITSRYRFTLPQGVDGLVDWHPVGPLSYAETLKLVWSLPNLDELPDQDIQHLWAAVGGHPRTLEIVDALLGHGRARLAHLQKRLTSQLEDRLGTREAQRWVHQGRTLDAAIADAATVAADDILLPELLSQLSPEAVLVLHALSVYREPVGYEGLLFAIGDPDQAAEYLPDRRAASERIEQALDQAGIRLDPATGQIDLGDLPPELLSAIADDLHELRATPHPARSTLLPLDEIVSDLADSTLLSHLPDTDEIFVHRWIAGELQRIHTGAESEWGSWHTAAAGYWAWRVQVWSQDEDADLHDLLEARHHYLEAGLLDLVDEVSSRAAGIQDRRGAWDAEQALINQMLVLLPEEDQRRAWWLHQAGILAQARGDYEGAEARYEQALTISERLGDQARMAASYHQLGWLAQARGDYESAQARYEHALTISERLGDQAGMAASYHQLGMLAQDRGDYESAQARCEKALTISERLGDQASMAAIYHQLGNLAYLRRDYEGAEARYEQALTISERLGDQAGMAASYHQFGMLAQARGDYESAEASYEHALTVFERLGDQARMAASYHQLGMLAQARGDYESAQARYEQALTIAQALGDQARMAASYHQLGILAQHRGDYESAQAHYEQCLTIAQRLGDQAGMAASYHQFGMLAQARGDYESAQARYEQSLTISERLGDQARMATSYEQLGRLAQNRGDHGTAQGRQS